MNVAIVTFHGKFIFNVLQYFRTVCCRLCTVVLLQCLLKKIVSYGREVYME